MRFCLAIGFALAVGLSADAGPLTICSKHQVVKLNQRIHGAVLDFTDNHRCDRRFWSDSLCSNRDMYVYLPPGFDPSQRYPLMIWMHGFIQDEKDFLDLAPRFDAAIAAGELPPMIIAAPDGSITGRPTFLNAGSFYINSRAGRFEDYLAVDVWNFLVANFPIRPERDAHVLAGGSMGGFGAYNLGIKYKDRFKVIVGILSPLNMRYLDCHGRYFTRFDPNCIGWEERYRPHASIGCFYHLLHVQQKHMIDPLFGRDRDAVAKRIAAENPVEMLESYDVKPGEMHFFIGYGERDEFNLAAQAESFIHFAKKRGIEPHVVVDPKGRHRSETGIGMMPEFNAWLNPLLKPFAPPLKLCEPLLQ